MMMFGNQLGPADLSDLVSLSAAGPLPSLPILRALVNSPKRRTEMLYRIAQWQRRRPDRAGFHISRIRSLNRFWSETWPLDRTQVYPSAEKLGDCPISDCRGESLSLARLKTVGELVELSRVFGNCIKDLYVEAAVSGRMAFYQVFVDWVVVAVLSLERYGNTWAYHNCLGPLNCAPPDSALSSVQIYLHGYGIESTSSP